MSWSRIILFAFSLVLTPDLAWSAPKKPKVAEKKEETPPSDRGVRFDQTITRHWRVGVRLTASAGACNNLQCSIPVPMDWTEQTVTIGREDISPNVTETSYSVLDEGGVRQMHIHIGHLNDGEEAHVIVTFDVAFRTTLPPEDVTVYKIPERKHITKDLERYLKVGSYIEVRHPLIRKANAESIDLDKDANAWEQVRAIYEHVREKVEYREGPLKGAVQAIKDGYGDCESMTCLFIAMCRAHRIPARMVWVVDHAYPEFYLVDDRGAGHWFPCQVAGSESFGGMPDPRPILQKGEDYKVPGQKGRQHYVAEYLTGAPVRGAGQPTVAFIREFVDSNGAVLAIPVATPDAEPAKSQESASDPDSAKAAEADPPTDQPKE